MPDEQPDANFVQVGDQPASQPTTTVVGSRNGDVLYLTEFPAFAGGALTFGDADAYFAAQDQEWAARGETMLFEAIIENIQNDDSLDAIQKAEAIGTLSAELADRIRVARAEAETGERSMAHALGERGLTAPPSVPEQAEPIDHTINPPQPSIAERAADAETHDPGSLTVFRDQETGDWRWLALHTNRYEDRYGTIFSEDAHRDYVQHVNDRRDFPPLRLWHVPIDVGQSDWMDYADGFVVSTGTFNRGFEHVAESLAQESGLRCSHGFTYRAVDLVDDVFNHYRSFEITALPGPFAGNPLTAWFAEKEEAPMGFTSEQRAFLVRHLGATAVDTAEDRLGSMRSQAEAEGLDYRALTEAVRDAAAADPAPPAAAAPAAVAPAAPAVAAAAAVAAAVEPTPTPEPAPAAPVAAAPAPAAAAAPAEPAPAAAAPAADPPDPEPAANPLVEALREVMAAELAPIRESITALQAGHRSTAEAVTALGASEGTRLAELIRPRVGPTDDRAASANPDNVAPSSLVTQLQQSGALPADGEGKRDEGLQEGASAASSYAMDAVNSLGGNGANAS